VNLERRVSAALDAAGIAHALIGAAALAAAGVARSTLDLDFLTIDTRVLDDVLWHSLLIAGATVECRRGDPDDPLAGVVRITAPDERPVDVIVGRFAWQRRALDRATTLTTGVRVVLPRDLILLKLFAGGTQDLWDIRQLLDAMTDVILVQQVNEDLPDLPRAAADLWSEVRARPR
jgi:hypothetical protein